MSNDSWVIEIRDEPRTCAVFWYGERMGVAVHHLVVGRTGNLCPRWFAYDLQGRRVRRARRDDHNQFEAAETLLEAATTEHTIEDGGAIVVFENAQEMAWWMQTREVVS